MLSLTDLNKIGFGVLAIAALMNILKKQRDAVGLSVYGPKANSFYAPEKSSERHFQDAAISIEHGWQSKRRRKKIENLSFLSPYR